MKKSLAAILALSAPILAATDSAHAALGTGDRRDDSTFKVMCSSPTETNCIQAVSVDNTALFRNLIEQTNNLANEAWVNWGKSEAGLRQNVSRANRDCDGGGDGCSFQNYRKKLGAAQCKLDVIQYTLDNKTSDASNRDTQCTQSFYQD